MPVAKVHNRVWWWNLDRDGKPMEHGDVSKRPSSSPPLKNGSPYTPNFYVVDEELPGAHLHHKDGHITGIHGEGDLAHLRLTLLMCLLHERVIIRHLAPKHHIDIMLKDVLEFFDSDP